MFNGQKIAAIRKSTVVAQTGFTANMLDSLSGDVERIATDYFNAVDNWAAGYGYEMCGATDALIIFKRVR